MASTIESATASAQVTGKPARRQWQAVFPEVIEVKATITEASIAAGVVSQASLTVPGASLGDPVLVTPRTNAAGLRFQGQVSAADTVVVTLWNMETVDANTTASGGIVVNVHVLKTRSNFTEL